MTHRLSQFTPIADAIVKLFYPHAEVVLHDIIDDTIAYIGNPFSGRAVGDVSYLGLDPKKPSLRKDMLGIKGRMALLKRLDEKGLFYARKSVQ